jgi:hypothetical protein
MRHAWLFILILLLIIAIGFIVASNRIEAPTVSTPEPVHTVPTTPTVLPASKDDMIVLDSPLPGATISSPLTITGKARGNWYFEASFPIILTDWDGRIIAEGHAEAQGDWMTTNYVPFKAVLTYTKPDTSVSNRGSLILKKDNPSGEPKNDNALEIEVRY